MGAQEQGFTFKKISEMFDIKLSANAFYAYEEKGALPKATRIEKGKTSVRQWSKEDLPKIGEKFGFMKRPDHPTVLSFFTQKGGTGKTPLAFQFARIAALHNLRVLVIGLDSQETITNILKGSRESDSLPENLEDLYDDGLFEVYQKEAKLEEVIQQTDLPTLDFIPENAGLAALENQLNHATDPLAAFGTFFFGPLKASRKYDYIVCDCNPAWGRIINSVLAATDFLVSPLKCDASTLNTTKTFFTLLSDFEHSLKHHNLEIEKMVIPTMVENSKLSRQVLSYYETTYSEICSKNHLKKTVLIDEAQLLQLSLMEHQPKSPAYKDLILVLKEIDEFVNFMDDEEDMIVPAHENHKKTSEAAL